MPKGSRGPDWEMLPRTGGNLLLSVGGGSVLEWASGLRVLRTFPARILIVMSVVLRPRRRGAGELERAYVGYIRDAAP
jgi:hypothetical protein